MRSLNSLSFPRLMLGVLIALALIALPAQAQVLRIVGAKTYCRAILQGPVAPKRVTQIGPDRFKEELRSERPDVSRRSPLSWLSGGEASGAQMIGTAEDYQRLGQAPLWDVLIYSVDCGSVPGRPGFVSWAEDFAQKAAVAKEVLQAEVASADCPVDAVTGERGTCRKLVGDIKKEDTVVKPAVLSGGYSGMESLNVEDRAVPLPVVKDVVEVIVR